MSRKRYYNVTYYDVLENKVNKKRRKKKLKNPDYVFRRFKSDNFTLRQHEIYKELQKHFKGFELDFYKNGRWLDFVDQKHGIIINIVGNKGIQFNNDRKLRNLGWSIFYIGFNDISTEAMTKLIGDIEFHISKWEFIKKRSSELNNETPKSERWFREKFQKEPFFKKLHIKYNHPMFGRFIFDLYIPYYRLCIEIDGSIHELPEVQKKDKFKTEMTRRHGFNIIRVKAYDDESYDECIKLINMLIEHPRGKKNKLEKQQDFNEQLKKVDLTKKLPF